MVSAIFTRVVFPAPFGPSNPKMLPGSTAKLTSRRARTSRLDHHRRNVFVREVASKAGGMPRIISHGRGLKIDVVETIQIGRPQHIDYRTGTNVNISAAIMSHRPHRRIVRLFPERPGERAVQEKREHVA